MDPEDPLPRPAQGWSSSTIIIRWWHETGADTVEPSNADLRGTIIDLGGRTLGHFAGHPALFDLVHGITSRPAQRRSPLPRTGKAKA